MASTLQPQQPITTKPTKRSKGDVNVRGPAHLAYMALDDGEEHHSFQGHVVDSASKQFFGFMSERMYLFYYSLTL